MTTPLPGLTIKITSETELEYLNTQYNIIQIRNQIAPVTNYEYELRNREENRKILILKPEYLSVFTGDMRNIMKYGPSSQYIDDKTKRAYNPKLKEL